MHLLTHSFYNPIIWHGYVHGNICNTHQVHDVSELKQRLTKVWHSLGQSVINDAMGEWHKRLWASVHVKGAHFEYLL